MKTTSLSTSTSFLHLKKAFTLIELLIVIGIIGVLTATLAVTLTGSGESAKAAKCMANMRNLAMAVQAYGMERGHYPRAGSIEYMEMNTARGKRQSRLQYKEVPGWVSWASQNHYPTESKKGCETIGLYAEGEETWRFAVTNGAIWKYVGDASVYTCPVHARKGHVNWSYFMNAYFGWSASEGYAYSPQHAWGIEYANLGGAERILLFAEIPFQGPQDWWYPSGEGGSTDTDGVLQYKGCSKARAVSGPSCRDGNEHIGANHKIGKDYIAQVIFADGHAEKLLVSSGKNKILSADDMRELTTFLCTGKSVTFTNGHYEELK